MRQEAPQQQQAPAISAPAPQPAVPSALARIESYAELIALAGAKRDIVLKIALESTMRPVSFGQGSIEVALVDGTDPGIIATLSARLQAWTGERWLVNVSNKAPEGKTVREERVAREKAAHDQAHEDPLVQAILETFPGAKVVNVKLRDDAVVVAPETVAPPEPEEDDE